MLINFTNHPSSKWSDEQRKASEIYGDIIDIPFPAVDPTSDTAYFDTLADEYLGKIGELSEQPVVLIQGEFVLTYRLVNRLKEIGIICIAAESSRNVKEMTRSDGTTEKVLQFRFEKYMEY